MRIHGVLHHEPSVDAHTNMTSELYLVTFDYNLLFPGIDKITFKARIPTNTIHHDINFIPRASEEVWR